jgi:hypothetical protein
VYNEKATSDLGRAVGAPVAEVRLDRVEGQAEDTAFCVAHGAVSVDVRHLREDFPERFASPEVRNALTRASALLPFHAWVGTEDLKDDHVVVAQNGDTWSAVAIDFASALRFPADGGVVTAPAGPPSLIENPDKQTIAEAVGRIEGCSDEAIETIIKALPEAVLPATEKDRVLKGLKERRGRVREAMRSKGWLS